MRPWAILFLTGCAAPAIATMPPLEREIRHALASRVPEATVSVWLARAQGGEILALNADRRVPAASTIKILLLVEGHAQEAEGTFRWTDSVTLRDEDRVGGAGSLQREPAGSTWTWLQLGRRMIAESDNTASNMLLERLGMASVNARAARLGLAVTRFGRLFMDTKSRQENWTTAREMGELVSRIYRREILTPEACDAMIATLENTGRRRIASGVPKFIAVGHKGGSLPGIRHDVGWVRVPGQPYVLSVFLENVLERRDPADDRGIDALEAVGRAVYRALGPGEE